MQVSGLPSLLEVMQLVSGQVQQGADSRSGPIERSALLHLIVFFVFRFLAITCGFLNLIFIEQQ